MTYQCGTCGSTKLRITARAAGGWQVTCGDGHDVAPDPATVIVYETRPPGVDRPTTIEEHLAEAQRLLALAYLDDSPDEARGGYYNGDDYGTTQVAAAEVHARIAHAMTAVEMLDRPQENPAGPIPPGLASLTKLADAMDRIAAGWERDQESTFSGRRGPTE